MDRITREHRTTIGLLLLLVAVARPLPAVAADPSPAPTIVTATGTFLPASPLDRAQATHAFVFTNATEHPITITQLAGSCPCTTGTVTDVIGANGKAKRRRGADWPLPLSLAAGESLRVHVALDLSEPPAGPVQKSLAVYGQTEGQTSPAVIARYTLQGAILPAIAFGAPVLDLGAAVAAGQIAPTPEEQRRWTVSVAYDPRLGDDLPPLLSSNPAITVSPLPPTEQGTLAPAPTAPHTPATEALARLTGHRTYAIRLAADAPLGPVTGTLSFASPTAKLPVPAAAATLHSVSVLVTGRIIGDVSAQPSMLAFGMTPTPVAGTTAKRQIVLTGANPAALSGLKATTPSPWLQVRLIAPETSGPVNSTALEVSLLPGAPAGLLQSEVKVTLASGRRLVVPITAYITPTPTAAAAK